MVSPEPFWLDSPSILLTNLELVPTCDMTKEERLNAITRLLLIISLILFILVKSTLWLTVLVSGLVVILIIYFFNVKRRQGFRMRPPLYAPVVGALVSAGATAGVNTVAPLITPIVPAPAPAPAPLNPPRFVHTGTVGTETKLKPRTTICNLNGIKPTVTFRKRWNK